MSARVKAGAADESAAAEGTGVPDGLAVLLWAAAGVSTGQAQFARELGLTEATLAELAQRYPEYEARARRMRALGARISRDDLTRLLRAQLAGLLAAQPSMAELAALLRVFDKLPLTADERETDDKNDSAPELSALDLAATLSEARALLSELERENEATALACVTPEEAARVAWPLSSAADATAEAELPPVAAHGGAGQLSVAGAAQ